MKRIFLLLIAALAWSTAHAQLPAPKQTDTLVITGMIYNYDEIRRENWPFTVIYKSTSHFIIGGKEFRIIDADRDIYGDGITFDIEDQSTSRLYSLNYEEYGKSATIWFSGYVFKCYIKEPDSETSTVEILEEEIPFAIIEEKPTFNGGDPAVEFQKWVYSRLEYPEVARVNNIQGRVIVSFLIDKDGSIKDIKILRGVDPSLDNEALRVISESPKWTPGKQRNKTMKVRFTFPIVFQLR